MKHQYFLQEPDFRVGNIDTQNVSRSKGYRHAFKSGRAKHGFIYTVNGSVRDVFSAGESITVRAGELVFVPRGCVYTCEYTEENTEIKLVQFELVGGTLPDYLSVPTKIGLPNAQELIDAFFKPECLGGARHPFYYLARLYELLWQIDRSCSGLPSKYKKLGSALGEIAAHPQRNETVAYYAALCNMSEVSFRRLFRAYTGKSPIEYRNDLRLDLARA